MASSDYCGDTVESGHCRWTADIIGPVMPTPIVLERTAGSHLAQKRELVQV
ncbi:MAG: hypothetical protein QOK20_3594 [Acidimicrobiaceae bacterium]|nr:hypothetical protein [Acidimicrobiaceae bacterium]